MRLEPQIMSWRRLVLFALIQAPLIAACIWMFRRQVSGVHPAAVAALLGPLVLPHVLILRQQRWGHLLFAVMLEIEFIAALLAYHTIGEIISGFFMLLTWLNLIPAALFLSEDRRFRLAAGSFALTLFLAIVPYHAWLGWRWYAVHTESNRIIAYVLHASKDQARAPVDLMDYVPHRPWTMKYIRYRNILFESRPEDSMAFIVAYTVGTEATNHSFMGPEGPWFYYPD